MTYDKRAYTDLVKLSKAIIGDDSDFKLDELEKALYGINTGIAAGYIAGRLYTALKQTLSGVSYAEFADMYRVNDKEIFALGLHKFVFYAKYQYNQKNPIRLIKNHRFFLKNSVAYSERIKKGNTGDEFLEYLLNNRGKNIFKELFAYIAKIGITPNKIVDALTISSAGMVYYKQQYKKYSKVMSDKAAREKAMNDFEISFNLTQQSSSKPNLAPIQIRKGVLTSMFGTFKNAQMGYFRRITANSNNVLRDYVNQKEKFQRLGYNKVKARAKAFNIIKTAKTWNEFSNILLYTHVMPMAWQYVASGLPGLLTGWDEEDTEEMKRAAYLGALDGVFIVGDIAKYAYNKFKLGKKWKMSEWIAISEMETIFNDVKEASDEDGYFNKEVLWEITKALLKTKGLNIDTYNNIYEGVESLVKEKEFSMDAILDILNAPKSLRDKEDEEDKVTITETSY